MKWSWFGRVALALTSAVSLGLSMTACGGGTIGYLWAVGTDAQGDGQIYGYKVDHFTGNLTATPGQPYGSNGVNPVQVVVRPGGRFVYVINQGTGSSGTSAGTSEGIDLFAVGGEGSLTFEQHYDTQGRQHMWAAFDSTGANLYVLDKYSPNYQGDPTKASYDVNGSITTFSSDATTGRLQVVQQTASTPAGQASPLFLEVGQSPVRMTSTGSCLFTLNGGGQSVSLYGIANGQLSTVTTGVYPVGSTSASSISGNAQYIFITDTDNGADSGRIFNYTVSNCSLVPFTQDSITTNPTSATHPNNVLVSNSNKYFYVLNGNNTSTATTATGSLLAGYSVTSGLVQSVVDSPFVSGPGPQCAVEDPTSLYVYVANGGDGTITGYAYNDTQGPLTSLTRGSTFKTSALSLSCLAISGVV